MAALQHPPEVLLNASAIGYYGNRGHETLSENSNGGIGFLADVCHQWEQATHPARYRGIRVAMLRFGVILSPLGGALAKMLTPFRLGIGGKIGNGEQFMSWISLDDVLGIISHAMRDDSLSGPVNVVSPNPVTNREYVKTLGRVLRRPAVFPIPAFAARLKFGEMADELLLVSTRAVPEKLRNSNFEFFYPNLETALRHMLGRWRQDEHENAVPSERELETTVP